MTAGGSAGIITGTGCTEGGGGVELQPYSLNIGVWGGLEVRASQPPLPPSVKLSIIANRAAGFGSLNTIEKYELEAQDDFFHLLWQKNKQTTQRLDTVKLNSKGRFQCLVSYKCFDFKTRDC